MQVTERSPDDFLAELPDLHRADMQALDAIIAPVFTNDARAMWEGVFWGGSEQSIIGYGDLEQPRSKGETVTRFVVGLALQKSGISVYQRGEELPVPRQGVRPHSWQGKNWLRQYRHSRA